MFEVRDVVKCVGFKDSGYDIQGKETIVIQAEPSTALKNEQMIKTGLVDDRFFSHRFELIRKGYNTICLKLAT